MVVKVGLVALFSLVACRSFSDSCSQLIKTKCERAQKCGGYTREEFEVCVSAMESVCAQRTLLNAVGEGNPGCRREGYYYNFSKADACNAAIEKQACGTQEPAVCSCPDCEFDFCEPLPT